MKRRPLYVLTLLFTGLLVLFSCRKDIEYYLLDRDRPTSEVLENAKIWYLQSIDRENVRQRLKPHWKDAWTVSRERRSPIVVVPANERRVRNRDISIRRFFVFTLRGEDVADGNIVELVGEKYDVSKNLDFLLQAFGKDEIDGFTGSVITYDVNYGNSTSAVFKDGKRIHGQTEIESVNPANLKLELKSRAGLGKSVEKLATASPMSYGGVGNCLPVTPVWNGPPTSGFGEDCIVNVTITTLYDPFTGCLISHTVTYNFHTCPDDESGESGSGSSSGESEENPPYGGGGGQERFSDKVPSSYIWRNILKTIVDFRENLPVGEDHFLRDENGELIYDESGEVIPNPNVFNCHYDAFGANIDPNAVPDPRFPQLLLYPDLSNYTALAPGAEIQVGDKVVYYIWQEPTQDWKTAVRHSATVTQIDNDGYATEVRSKMGDYYGTIYHHPRDIPESYGPTSPYTNFANGTKKYNRVYYRQK